MAAAATKPACRKAAPTIPRVRKRRPRRCRSPRPQTRRGNRDRCAPGRNHCRPPNRKGHAAAHGNGARQGARLAVEVQRLAAWGCRERAGPEHSPHRPERRGCANSGHPPTGWRTGEFDPLQLSGGTTRTAARAPGAETPSDATGGLSAPSTHAFELRPHLISRPFPAMGDDLFAERSGFCRSSSVRRWAHRAIVRVSRSLGTTFRRMI